MFNEIWHGNKWDFWSILIKSIFLISIKIFNLGRVINCNWIVEIYVVLWQLSVYALKMLLSFLLFRIKGAKTWWQEKTKSYEEKHIHNYTLNQTFLFSYNPIHYFNESRTKISFCLDSSLTNFENHFLLPFWKHCFTFNKWSIQQL